MSTCLPVDAVSDTALLLACYRAIESERADAHFHDPHARRLAGSSGRRLIEKLPGGHASGAGCVVRTCLFDEMLLDIVRDHRIDTVLNVGAGLDTRPYRLDLPSELRWIDVDTTAVIKYKAAALHDCRPRCRVEFVDSDITDDAERRSLLRRVAARAESVVVVSEGLLIYLDEEQVRSLATDFHSQPNVSWWLTDVVSREGLRVAGQMLQGNAEPGPVRLRFAPANGAQFFCALSWVPQEYRSCVEAGIRLGRWILPAPFVAQLSEKHQNVLRELSGVAKLRRSV
jgi:methyltransferase (TIGR00027 family)